MKSLYQIFKEWKRQKESVKSQDDIDAKTKITKQN